MPLPTALFKQSPADFVVDEIDAYPASGDGPHVLVRIRKTSLSTEAAVARLAEALGVDRRACGFAGMKDKDAITTQRVSLPDVDPARVLSLAGRWPDLEILEAERHRNKLKPGHLRGNRFRIRLRGVEPAALPAVEAGLDRIAREGFPNGFGPQRFGRDGDNADRALAFVRGEARPPRDPRERRLLFSALQARWFNHVLDARVADGTWNVPVEGDLLKKTDTGGMFLCSDVETDRARAARGELSPTGPIFGAEMIRPAGEVLGRELAALAADGIVPEALDRHRSLGEGTRRPLRVLIDDLVHSRFQDDTGSGIELSFGLGKGVYATTALANVVILERLVHAPGEIGAAAPHGMATTSNSGREALPLATAEVQGQFTSGPNGPREPINDQAQRGRAAHGGTDPEDETDE